MKRKEENTKVQEAEKRKKNKKDRIGREKENETANGGSRISSDIISYSVPGTRYRALFCRKYIGTALANKSIHGL